MRFQVSDLQSKVSKAANDFPSCVFGTIFCNYRGIGRYCIGKRSGSN